MRKRFDKALHEKTDNLAKSKAQGVFAATGLTLTENPNRHGVDILVYDNTNNHVFNLEVEIKTNWKKGQDFKYPTLNFLRRKEKYCTLDKPTIFMIFNEDLSQHLIVKDKDVLSSPLEEVPNKYVPRGEFFYKIPLSQVKFNDITSVIKEILK